jgi:hypothetical protein
LYDIQALPTLVGGHVRWHIHFTCVRALKLVIRNPLSSPPKKEGKKEKKKDKKRHRNSTSL